MSTTRYQRGQRVRFIRNSRLHLATKRGRIPDWCAAWETGEYWGPRRRGWHTVRDGLSAFAIPSRRLRPVKALVGDKHS